MGQYLSDSVAEMDLESVEWVFAYTCLVNVLDQGGTLDALLASGRLAEYFRMAEDPEFRAMLIFRRTTMWFSAQDLENASAEADEILTMIRAQLAEVGVE